ncbi:MarR family transcriptional regulator [Roseomonas sp. NAR14]|uniref:MarR family transcriptional regulator n=1 Tax=Roseomonas acroporae TaxID=2937791 RepID=A0A9X2BWA8_9PROT|nr:MarR family transcriptional regulator [Roseomonas acroporae]MCK8784814.1 MarR family transcriptional regulator [Roseomonas acroporae]
MHEDVAAIRAVRAIMILYREFEQAARGSEMNTGQYRTLLFLRSGPKRAGEIAEAAMLKKPTVTSRLNGLREKGWIRDSADPRDGRAARIEITRAGVAEMKSFERLLLRRFAELFPGDELDGMLAMLSRIYMLLGESKEARMLEVEELWLR